MIASTGRCLPWRRQMTPPRLRCHLPGLLSPRDHHTRKHCIGSRSMKAQQLHHKGPNTGSQEFQKKACGTYLWCPPRGGHERLIFIFSFTFIVQKVWTSIWLCCNSFVRTDTRTMLFRSLCLTSSLQTSYIKGSIAQF